MKIKLFSLYKYKYDNKIVSITKICDHENNKVLIFFIKYIKIEVTEEIEKIQTEVAAAFFFLQASLWNFQSVCWHFWLQ